jgi:hypothetical protein
MKKMTPEELEQFIHQQLRGLPDRRAPNSLESRVRFAIGQRAAIPWYHKSWSYWPAAIRTAFLVLATGIAGAVVAAFYFGFTGVEASAVVAQVGERLSFFTRIYHVASWIAVLGTEVFGRIPPLWLYGGFAMIAVLYATFFGLGAAAYRTLYRNN